jgi:hypothetical protein
VRIESFLFSSYLRAQLCPDLSECQARFANPAIVVTGGWSFPDGGDSNGWTSSSVFNESVDACAGTVESQSLTSPSDGVLEIRIERRSGVEFPLGPDGCNPDAAAAAAEGQPCVSLEIITATLSGPNPAIATEHGRLNIEWGSTPRAASSLVRTQSFLQLAQSAPPSFGQPQHDR